MTKTGFLWIETGDITWAGLLEGTAGVVGAFLVAGFVFWLERHHARNVELREAVEACRIQIRTTVDRLDVFARRNVHVDPETEARMLNDFTDAASRLRARAGKRDQPLTEAAYAVVNRMRLRLISNQGRLDEDDLPFIRGGANLLSMWLDGPRTVRKKRVTHASLEAEQKAKQQP